MVMNEQQAYAAMFKFIKVWYESTHADELGSMLGSMSLLRDGRTADDAVWQTWLEAVQFALDGGTADLLVLKRDNTSDSEQA